MGMYTGLRLQVIVKEEYREIIRAMMEDSEIEDWHDILNRYPEMEFIRDFANEQRSHMIPFGTLSYMPDEWETDYWHKVFETDTGYWQFQCSVNYGWVEIRKFIEDVVPVISNKVLHAESYYEEDRYGNMYELVDNKMVKNESLKVDYKPWKDEE